MSSLHLAVDRTSEVPLGTQLIWRLRTLIATGELAPGDRIPGIREVAESAGVNVNTVRSVFTRLEEQGLLRTEHGRGTFVASGVRVATLLASMAQAAIAQAQEAGIDPRELAAALYVTPAIAHSSRDLPAVTDERAERRSLRAQIARLERDVAMLDPIGTLETRPEAPAPRLLTAAELREIRAGLAGRLDELRRERDEWRIESEELTEALEEGAPAQSRRGSRWRGAGVWTGRPGARVSWTAP